MRVIVLLAILGSAVAVPRNGQRIIGGESTNIETYPFIANLQYVSFGIIWMQTCGGTLISSLTVLTSAHCVEDSSPNSWRAVLGTSMSSGEGGNPAHAIARMTIHPNYSGATFLDADLSLLHLASQAVLSNRVQTIPIASTATVLFPGLPVTAIGWGAVTPDGQQFPNDLQHAEVSIVDTVWCRNQYAELRNRPGFSGWPIVTDNMACAGVVNTGGRDACTGDSGGPIIFRGTPSILVGIISWGYQCALADYPGVLVRVPAFTEWIVANS